MYNNRVNKKVELLKDTFGNDILNQLNNIKSNKNISKINISYVKNKLKDKIYFKAFNKALIEFNKDEKNHQFTKIYMTNFEDTILEKIRKNAKKDDTIKTNQAFLIGEYKISNFEITEFLFKSLKSKSIYLRVASLKSISKLGSIDNFINAILIISTEEKYINSKMICDIINEFGGDKDLLYHVMIEKFDIFNENMQKTIVENFKNQKVLFPKAKLLEILKSEKYKKETKISIIKYFSIIKYNLAKETIINILDERDWEFRAVCASALSNYEDEDSKNILLKSISDKNWYVRYNSAVSLLKFEDEYIIEQVLHKNDQYSRDILFYAMFMKDEEYYKDYLINEEKAEGVGIC